MPQVRGDYGEDELKSLDGLEKAFAGHQGAEEPLDAAKLEVLSEEAAGQWTASFNPRDITAADFSTLYQKAFG